MKITALMLLSASVVGCGNLPTSNEKDRGRNGESLSLHQPGMVMQHLASAFNERDKDLYETLLDDDFQFTESDCWGELIYGYGKEEELWIMGTRYGASRGVFDIYHVIEWSFHLFSRWTGQYQPRGGAIRPDPIGGEEKDWESIRGRVRILLLEQPDKGVYVDQVMTFRLRESDDERWRIVRWMADPVSCDGGLSWGSIKEPLRK